MKTIYLVKKNSKQENNPDNWLVMNPNEFRRFKQSAESKGRLFSQMNLCFSGEQRIVVECDRAQSNEYHREIMKSLRNLEYRKKYGITIFSLEDVFREEEDPDGFIAEDGYAEDQLIEQEEREILHRALQKLSDEEYALIEALFLSGRDNVTSYAKKLGLTPQAVSNRKNKILRKIREDF